MISILLASYNGEKYIEEQIESILEQTVQDFKLIICDDKSTDTTFSIAERYAELYPEKIYITQNKENTGNPKYNFMKMMIKYKDEYVMLCDQDDVWLPNKIEKSLSKIHELENVYETSVPLMVHSDLRVVDTNLNILFPSYIKMAHTSYDRKALNNLLTRNITAGCTIMYNRALADSITEVPISFIMHDWWVALIASSFGQIATIYEPTILYRQHGNNDRGAKKDISFKNIYYRLRNYKRMASEVNDTYAQAESFLNIFRNKLTPKQCDLLVAYASVLNRSKVGRLRILITHKVFMYGVARKIAQLLLVSTERRVSKK